MKAAIYLRVSSDAQTTANQIPDIERIVAARGLELVTTYEETGSAAKHRPAFEEMMAAAHRGEFSVLVIWAIDRFGRSMAANVRDIIALDSKGVKVISVREPWLDTSGPVRDLLVAIFSWVAEQERTRLIERTNAGLQRTKRAGKRLGRPARHVNLERAEKLKAKGLSIRAIAAELGQPKSVIARALSQNPHPETEG